MLGVLKEVTNTYQTPNILFYIKTKKHILMKLFGEKTCKSQKNVVPLQRLINGKIDLP